MNPIRITLFVVASSLFLTVNQAHAVVIGFEDFEDSTVEYVLVKADNVTTQAEFLENDPGPPDEYAYFGRMQGTAGLGPLRASTTYLPNTDPPGTDGFFAINNTADSFVGVNNAFQTAHMDFNDIDISNFTDLSFSGSFAEDPNDAGLAENWDVDTSLRVFARIDSDNLGDYVQIFGIEANPAFAPAVDTNLDTEGDGTEITDTFQQFVASISGTGSLLDLRVSFINFDDEFLDLALDNLTLEGQAVPEPTSLALLGALAACGGGYRLRRRRQTAEDVV